MFYLVLYTCYLLEGEECVFRVRAAHFTLTECLNARVGGEFCRVVEPAMPRFVLFGETP